MAGARIRGPWVTQRNAQLVEVGFADGNTVRCTPDHLFATESGWKSAESLTPGTLIRLCSIPSSRYFDVDDVQAMAELGLLPRRQQAVASTSGMGERFRRNSGRLPHPSSRQ